MSERTCSFPDCGYPVRKVGLCTAHYNQGRRGQALRPVYRRGLDRRCQLEPCDRQHHCKGYCKYHYTQHQHGTPFKFPAPEPRLCVEIDCSREAVLGDLCKVHAQRQLRTGTTAARDSKVCSVDGCFEPHNAGGYCTLHYSRNKFMGSPFAEPSVRPAGSGTVSLSGYHVVGGRWDHPLSTKKGYLLVHRMVLYEAIGPGVHPCHWCAKAVDWALSWPASRDALVVDHLDFDKLNNDPANLVPSCGDCNKRRTKKGAS